VDARIGVRTVLSSVVVVVVMDGSRFSTVLQAGNVKRTATASEEIRIVFIGVVIWG